MGRGRRRICADASQIAAGGVVFAAEHHNVCPYKAVSDQGILDVRERFTRNMCDLAGPRGPYVVDKIVSNGRHRLLLLEVLAERENQFRDLCDQPA